MASHSSLDRQRFMCLSRYFFIIGGTENVPSLDFSREAGLSPSWSSWSESVPDSHIWHFCRCFTSSLWLEDGPLWEVGDFFLLREGPLWEAIDPLLLPVGLPDEAVNSFWLLWGSWGGLLTLAAWFWWSRLEHGSRICHYCYPHIGIINFLLVLW